MDGKGLKRFLFLLLYRPALRGRTYTHTHTHTHTHTQTNTQENMARKLYRTVTAFPRQVFGWKNAVPVLSMCVCPARRHVVFYIKKATIMLFLSCFYIFWLLFEWFFDFCKIGKATKMFNKHIACFESVFPKNAKIQNVIFLLFFLFQKGMIKNKPSSCLLDVAN